MDQIREISSIKKASRILDLFSLNRKELSISDISKELNFSKSSVYYILKTLELENFIQKNNSTNSKYRLGIKFLELGNLFKEHTEIRYYALSSMQELQKNTNESVYLNINIEENRVSIEKIDSSYSVRSIVPLGKSFPLYKGAAGKIILAFLEKSDRDKYLQKYKKNKKFKLNYIEKELNKARKLFYIATFGEFEVGSAALASPIFDYNGNVVASISIAGSSERIKTKNIKNMIKYLKNAAMKISFLLGYEKYLKERKIKNPYL